MPTFIPDTCYSFKTGCLHQTKTTRAILTGNPQGSTFGYNTQLTCAGFIQCQQWKIIFQYGRNLLPETKFTMDNLFVQQQRPHFYCGYFRVGRYLLVSYKLVYVHNIQNPTYCIAGEKICFKSKSEGYYMSRRDILPHRSESRVQYLQFPLFFC